MPSAVPITKENNALANRDRATDPDYEFDAAGSTDKTKMLMRSLIAEVKDGADGVEAAMHAAVKTWLAMRTQEAEVAALERRKRDMPGIHANTTLQESMRLSCRVALLKIIDEDLDMRARGLPRDARTQ